ncbi:protein arginine methyltransferase NDUFAF7, mitochondrial-like [Stylophora pistillata]|uniref:protein arginine methyltransferase NDUFAF7, mitochondrial-like n=1 Tax=Stylophora pistillata TaxID=50429 RepID=UPI000C04C525|nr:protein arginine methyltransferase NDUFAF7, mitochondrial-like [Stylophora pistillata]
MHLCLLHPQWGYYQHPTPIGTKGAFTTAPEISQMFGEILGGWVSDLCHRTHSSIPTLDLIELGPGRGTLMADLLKQKSVKIKKVHLVEQNINLRKQQEKVLTSSQKNLVWHTHLTDCLDQLSNPFILIANEFLDALPIRQFQKTPKGWKERLITTTDGETLALALEASSSLWLQDLGQEGGVLEICIQAEQLIHDLCNALEKNGGAALFIDYGAQDLRNKPTLQALKNHQHIPVLESPGESDLTAHVNFGRLKKVAQEFSSLKIYPLITQREFLLSLGLQQRANQLSKASPSHKAALDAAVQRLTHSNSMGNLFKVWCLTSQNFPTPEPFLSQGDLL